MSAMAKGAETATMGRAWLDSAVRDMPIHTAPSATHSRAHRRRVRRVGSRSSGGFSPTRAATPVHSHSSPKRRVVVFRTISTPSMMAEALSATRRR